MGIFPIFNVNNYIPRTNKHLYLSRKKGIYSIYTTIKPLLFHIDVGTVVGDTFVTTKKIMKESKELGMEYIGKLRKNIIVEYFGKKVKVEELFRMDFSEDKLKLRTVNGIEFRLSAKIVNISDVGKVKIVAVFMENQRLDEMLRISLLAYFVSENPSI
ncbi:hypothetical protein MetfoDRAFT_0185 [Methanotorris formicicus Mc-S-70]|uniref:Uncharacterized protein n=2 Tax=Methanotorris formicicus TaxID=213185 RepID=H1KWL2_9EURY|nr:hypothetical protein MetfoDRAFT_0185 [Methanotorris formicicus Mc-S-70]